MITDPLLQRSRFIIRSLRTGHRCGRPAAPRNDRNTEQARCDSTFESPTSPDTVLNDRTTKPVQYAKAGVPLYLLVDQGLGRWTLFGLAEGWQRYQMAADGAYGEEINLPAPLNFSLITAAWPRWK
jgi:Putative restriction endonuclease